MKRICSLIGLVVLILICGFWILYIQLSPIRFWIWHVKLSYMPTKDTFNELIDKSCNSDEDCTFVGLGCCSYGGPGEPVNKQSAKVINLVKKITDKRCKDFKCPQVYIIPIGQYFRYKPVCRKGMCVTEELISCVDVCSDIFVNYTSILEYIYMDYPSLNLSKFCECSNFFKIINGTTERPERSWTNKIILIGKVKSIKSDLIEIIPEKVFNKKMEEKYVAYCFKCYEYKDIIGKNVKATISLQDRSKSVNGKFYPTLYFIKELENKEYEELKKIEWNETRPLE